jgi:hypothetical protein
MLDRRTIIAGLAGALPAAAIGAAPALASPALAQLIERHRSAYRVYSAAVDAYDNDETDEENPAFAVASDAEYGALLTLCAYRCESIEGAGAKAAYLLTPSVLQELDYQQITALLQSFVPATA